MQRRPSKNVRARTPDSNIFFTQATKRSAAALPSRQLDGSRAGFDRDVDTPTTQSHPDMTSAFVPAWQDDRGGTTDVYFKRSVDGGVTFGDEERVDDTGTSASAQTGPAVAIDRSGARAARRM